MINENYEIQILMSINLVLLKHSHTHLFINCLWLLSAPRQQSSVVAAERKNIYNLVLYQKRLLTLGLECEIHSPWPGNAGHGNLDVTNLPKPYFLPVEDIMSIPLKGSSPFLSNILAFRGLLQSSVPSQQLVGTVLYLCESSHIIHTQLL